MDEKASLRHIMRTGQITTLFQPIVCLSDLSVLGYEALSRGPANSPLESATALFDRAERIGLARDLERHCFQQAIAASGGRSPGQKIFLNISPFSLPLGELLGSSTFALGQIVLELSERNAVSDYKWFLSAIRSARAEGFELSLDNMGEGYSGLDKLVELEPAYCKLSRAFATGIDCVPFKREMVETLLIMAQRTGARVVAQGIETAADLECLRELGIELVQGFHLGRPGPM